MCPSERGENRTRPGMTREQRDFLRKQIDTQMRERVERARSAKAQAKTEALERPRLEEAVASADRLPVTVRGEGDWGRSSSGGSEG